MTTVTSTFITSLVRQQARKQTTSRPNQQVGAKLTALANSLFALPWVIGFECCSVCTFKKDGLPGAGDEVLDTFKTL